MVLFKFQYSIDGLLEQTVKHMMYLRSVTDQAEKLKNWVHQQVCMVYVFSFRL